MNFLSRYIAIISRLNARQWWAMVVSIFMLSSFVLKMRRRPFSWCWQRIHNPETVVETGSETVDNKQQDLALELHESVRLAARVLPFKCECLPKAVVLRDLLVARSIPAVVRLGVNKQQMLSMQSHAWVEVDGQAIAENDDLRQSFKPL
ncbi:MAG: lasso peptide biosynthesis B2 protein [Arenicella sp.]